MSEPAPAAPRSIQLASSVADTARLHAWLDEWLAAADVPERTGHAVRLCLEEVVMNVILHGYGLDQPGRIGVSLTASPSGVEAVVLDSAAPFDPTAPRPERRATALHEGPLGGRGLGLIRKYASRVAYRREGGQNRLDLGFGA